MGFKERFLPSFEKMTVLEVCKKSFPIPSPHIEPQPQQVEAHHFSARKHKNPTDFGFKRC